MEDTKERLDIFLLKKGFFDSRERAREAIKNKEVFLDGKIEEKCGRKVDLNAKIEFVGRKNPYVSRGGLKLEKAIKEYNIDLTNKICMDIGASTGGFTDCMMQNQCSKVYAIDVGTDQLHEKLRVNHNVISMENTNIKDLSLEEIGEEIDFISIDVSFISLEKVLPKAKEFLKKNGELLALIKPQFQCTRGELNKKGVVKNKKSHIRIIKEVIDFSQSLGLKVENVDYSPIKGPNGNIEYLMYCKNNNGIVANIKDLNSVEIVERAFSIL